MKVFLKKFAMMTRIKNSIRRNRILTEFVRLMFVVNSWRSRKISLKRKKESIFNFHELAKNMPKSWLDHPVMENNYYGLVYVLKKKAKLKKTNPRVYFEHGIVFGSFTYDILKDTFCEKLLTFGSYRELQIKKKHEYLTISIGPYIEYAEFLLNEVEINNIKNQLGKVLLVFPSHSIDSTLAEFDEDFLIDEISKYACDFDTVLVCLYWKDIQLGRFEKYENAGYKITTAGHINDIYFLSRLKSIIEVSDFTMSNSIGTHIGYAVHMNKPHMIINQKVTSAPGKVARSFERGKKLRSELDYFSLDEIKLELMKAFSHYNKKITEEQYGLVRGIWGTDKIKSHVELFNLLK